MVPDRRDPLAARRAAVADGLVGRDGELDLILAAVAAGRDLLLEGPPGTSKSTILRGITGSWGIPFVMVEGNADLTPAKLIGHHNPARVLREDYSADNFVAGPLVAAMRDGGFLYIEEFNRAPEDTLNALLTAMAEREVVVPRVGRIAAADSFRLVASMNPFDNVGTTRISASIYDRLCRLAIGYQAAGEEVDIVALRTSSADRRLIGDAVALTRATRSHPAVRLGSSVRGAIDLVLVAERLVELRGEPGDDRARAELILEAALLALSGRVNLDEITEATSEQIITEIWEDHFVLHPARAAPGHIALDVDNPIQRRLPPGERPARRARRPLTRKPKRLDAVPDLYRSTAGGGLVLMGNGRGPSTRTPPKDAVGSPRGAPTSERGETVQVEDLIEGHAIDPSVSAMVQRIAGRLSVRRRPRDRVTRPGQGRIMTAPYRYSSDDIDLDRTLEVLTERPMPEDTDILVRERMQTRRAVTLIGDVSGSMRGEKVRIAAAAIGALAGDLVDDELGVVAFWKDAALVKPIDTHRSGEVVLRDLLRIPARGLTNVAFGLEIGLRELRRARARTRIGILLSDAVHNAGPDPRDVAPGFERLHVLLETDGEHDEQLARELAQGGHGELVPISHFTQVPAALNHLLGA
jgi:MoxR-like ATPase